MVTSQHLNVRQTFSSYGVKESGVLFHVIEEPRHGKLDVTVWQKTEENIFTLLDINTDKVILKK